MNHASGEGAAVENISVAYHLSDVLSPRRNFGYKPFAVMFEFPEDAVPRDDFDTLWLSVNR